MGFAPVATYQSAEELLRQYYVSKDPGLLNRLLSINGPYIRRVARSRFPFATGLLADELFVKGLEGLAKAIENYDPNKYFPTYMHKFVVGYMHHHLDDERRRKNKFGRSLDELAAKSGDGVPKDHVNRRDLLAQKRERDPAEAAESNDLRHILLEKVKEVLDQREQIAVLSFYGLGDNSFTVEEIADLFSVSKVTVRYIRFQALRKLRNELPYYLTV